MGPTPPAWRRYLRFWGPDVDADVEDELRFHLEQCAADLEARGHSPEEARRLARARFGDPAPVRRWLRRHDRRRQRREERIEYMDALLLDLRYAVRKLRQQRAFTLSVVLVLALGIGAATAMFSVVDAALLRPLPFQHDDRLVTLDHVNIPTREFAREKRMPDIGDARAMRDVFTHVAAYAPGGLNLAGAGDPVRARVALVTPDLFATLGVRPAHGRGFTPEEGGPDGPRAVILSDGAWRRQFGADPQAIGRDVRLNDVPHRIVGVMPPAFTFPEETELWLPLPVPFTTSRWEAFRQYMPSHMIARLAPGVTPEQASARLEALVRRYQTPEQRAEPLEHAPVASFREMLVGKRRTALLVLMGATALVLLVACANVTNLLLSRAASRRAELTLRAALGAGRGRLVRQLLVESVILAVAGGALGAALAYASLGALGALMPTTLAGTAAPQVDLRVLAFSLAVALVTGLLFGLWPALGASRADANETIKAAGSGLSGAREGARLRRVFVVAELALALMLAVGAGLMLRSLQALLQADVGLRPERVATLELSLASATYPDEQPWKRRRFYEAVVDRLQGMPGVQAAAAINQLPLSRGAIAYSVAPLGRPAPDDGGLNIGEAIHVTPGYFDVVGIPFVRGPGFTVPHDSTTREVVVNERLARRFWPDADAVGQRLVAAMHDTLTVVGVVGDVRAWSLEEEPNPQMYTQLAAAPVRNVALVARGDLPPGVLGRRLQEAVRAVDPSQAVYNVRPLEELVATAMAPRRASTALITTFGGIAVLLAAVGVYGVIAYGIARRTREIGIRVALGARRGDVLALVLREGVVLALLGVALGLAGAWALRRVLESLLYGVTPADPVTFAGAALALLAIALVATLLPARQALRVDPVRTMRAE